MTVELPLEADSTPLEPFFEDWADGFKTSLHNKALTIQQKQLLRSLIKEVKLGYEEERLNQGKKKVIPKSILLKFTGEQLEIVNKNLGLWGSKKLM